MVKVKAPVPITPEAKQLQEDATNFKNAFATCFSVKKLEEIFDKEVELNPNFEAFSYQLEKKKNLREKDFLSLIPKSIEYIQERMFHSADSDYYVLSYSKDKGYFPKQYSKVDISDTYTKYFPALIKKWWSTYSTLHYITINIKEKRIFTDDTGTNYLNLFNGFPDDNVKRNPEIMKQQADNIKYFWKHVKENLCSNTEEIYQEYRNWSFALLGGRRKMKTAIYMNGSMGVGKSVVPTFYSKIVGHQNYFLVQKPEQILGNFNGHLAGKLLVFIDDLSLDVNQFSSLYENLKVPITETSNTYRALFKDAITLENISSFMVSANKNIMKIEAQAGKCRRLINCDATTVLPPQSHFDKLWKLVEDDNFRRAFLWDCQDNYDPNYNEQKSIKTLPMTKSGIQTVQYSITPKIEFFRQKVLTENDTIFNRPIKPQDMYYNYCNFYSKNANYDKKRLTQARIWKDEIKAEVFLEHKSNYRMNGQAQTNWIFPNREKCLAEYIRRGFITEDDLIENGLTDADTTDDVVELEELLKQMKNDVEQLEETILQKKIVQEEQQEEKKSSTIEPTIDISKNIIVQLPTNVPELVITEKTVTSEKPFSKLYTAKLNEIKRLKELGEDSSSWEEELKKTPMYITKKTSTLPIQQELPKKVELIQVESSSEEEEEEEEDLDNEDYNNEDTTEDTVEIDMDDDNASVYSGDELFL